MYLEKRRQYHFTVTAHRPEPKQRHALFPLWCGRIPLLHRNFVFLTAKAEIRVGS
jgi:hypothetical protein